MNDSIPTISFSQLSFIFVPVGVVIGLLHVWSLDWKNAIYAMIRMVLQLLLIGYCLTYIFEANQSGIILIVLMVMVSAASWIALRTIPNKRMHYLKVSLLSIFVGGGIILLLVTQLVLKLDPWFMPRYVIPFAGMIFASSMNGVSLSAERFFAEIARGELYTSARRFAFRAAMIPITNSLFAVGLVSLPGMMTGQILSGISPLIAVRYQIVVMCMIFSAVGFSTALFLHLIRTRYS